MNRAEKIVKLAGLLTGTISKEEFKPKHYCIMIGWGELKDGTEGNLYLVDGKTVTRSEWDKINPHLLVDGFEVSYGDHEN
jgi:hypothetical protein